MSTSRTHYNCPYRNGAPVCALPDGGHGQGTEIKRVVQLSASCVAVLGIVLNGCDMATAPQN